MHFWSRLWVFFFPVRLSLETVLPSLDGARGLAVLMVVLDHASDDEMRFFVGADMNRMGKYGVYLFFALSAFLLTYPFLNRTAAQLRAGRTWANFFLRRFLRIVPLYALALLYFAATGYFTWAEAADHLLMRDGQSQFWTIPVEFKFYLLLPVVALAFVCLTRRAWGAALALGAAFWLGCEWVLAPLEKAWSVDDDVHLARVLEPFLLGSAAGALHWQLTRHPVPPRLRPWLEGVAILCLLAILLRVPAFYEWIVPGSGEVKSFRGDQMFCGVVWALFLVAHLHGTGGVRRLFSWRPLGYFGLISFSAYLWHREVLRFVGDLPLSSLAQLLLSFAILLPVASLTYLLIERPLTKIRLPRPACDRAAVSLPSG